MSARPVLWCRTDDCLERTPVGWSCLATVVAAGWTCAEHEPTRQQLIHHAKGPSK